MTALGLASGSVPGADASEMISLLRRLELGTVDLRWGKGHAWEPDGLTPFYAAGARVAFVGLSVTLGEGEPDLGGLPGELETLLGGRCDLPLKVFAAASLDSPRSAGWLLAERQLGVLTTVSQAPALVETHHGYAGLAALARLCREQGCRVLLDLGGFFRLTGGFADPAGVVPAFTTAVQVKGFRAGDPGTHRCLSELPPAAWSLLARVPDGAPVTIESKSGTLAEDVALLRDRYVTSGGAGH